MVVATMAVGTAPASAATSPRVPGPAGETKRSAHPKAPVLRHKSDKVVLAPSTAKSGGFAALTPANAVKGTGEMRNGTMLEFPLTDQLTAKVNVGSGNLLVTSKDLVLPDLKSGTTMGAAYNSLFIDSALETGAFGHGWRIRNGIDVRLVDNGNNSLTYVAPDGATGVFTESGTGYTSPGEFKATLAHEGTGWKLTDHESGVASFFYSTGELWKYVDRDGQVVSFLKNSSSQQSRFVGNRGPTTIRSGYTAYGSHGFIATITQNGTDSTSRVITYGYDSAGNLTTITSPDNETTVFGYDSAHHLTSIEPPAGKTTVTYDSSHRVTSLTRWDTATSQGGVTRLSYPSSTQTLVADANTDPAQAITAVPRSTYTVNATKRVTSVVDPAGKTQSSTYTGFQDVASSTDAYSKATTNTYGANGGQSKTQTQLPTGAATTWAYANTASTTNPTANFQPSSATDPQAKQTLFTYGGTGNKLQSQDATTAAAKVTYNSDGTVATSTDPANGTNATTYSYNTDKQLTGTAPPTGTALGARTFTYDAYGRLASATDGAGRTIGYGYDKDDRVTDVGYSDGTTPVHYDYDANGNLTQRLDASGTSTWYYNSLDRVTDYGVSHFSNWKSYGYDWVGNTTWIYDGRGTNAYNYDSRNLMTTMTVSDSNLRYNFSYDDNGRRTTTLFDTNTAGTTHSAKTYQTFDDSGRIKSTVTSLNNDPNNVGFDAAYCYTTYTSGQPCATTGDSDLLKWKKDFNAAVTTYGYDNGNRVTTAAGSGNSKGYAYNNNGNRTSVTTNGTTSQTLNFNAGNQITTTGYTHDGAGNQLTAPGDSARTFNAAKQMTSSNGGGTSTTLLYGGPNQNELAKTTTSAKTIYYTYGLPDLDGVPQVSSFHIVDNATSAQSDYYIERDPATGQPLGMQQKTGSTHQHYGYIIDGLGTINNMVATNGGGLTSTGYDYWPYGEPRNTATIYNPINTINPLGYAAGVKTAGLTKFGTRWYDSTTGRFTQQDSLSFLADPTNGNRYAYAGDNPVTFIDPTGLLNIRKIVRKGAQGAVGGALAGCILTAAAGCGAGAGVAAVGGAILGTFNEVADQTG